MSKCSVTGCEKPTRTRTAVLCAGHYHRKWKTGDVGSAVLKPRRGRSTCSEVDCDEPVRARGRCLLHDRRVQKGGTPDYVPEPRRGEDNHAWKGRELIAYGTAHERVERDRGKATGYPCASACGRQASHWAYQHTDPEPMVTPAGLPYSGNPAHYAPMCVPCHKRADLDRARPDHDVARGR